MSLNAVMAYICAVHQRLRKLKLVPLVLFSKYFSCVGRLELNVVCQLYLCCVVKLTDVQQISMLCVEGGGTRYCMPVIFVVLLMCGKYFCCVGKLGQITVNVSYFLNAINRKSIIVSKCNSQQKYHIF